MPLVSQILSSSYPAVLDAMKKPANQWAESALLREMDRQGMINRVDLGSTIDKTLDYRRNPDSAVLATDFTATAVTKTEVITSASYAVAEVSVPINWSKADEAKNPSENQKIDLVKSLIVNGVESHDDILEATLFTTSNGLIGFDTLLTETGVGTIGGIVAGTDTFWKNQFDEFTDATDIEATVTSLYNLCAKGSGSALAPTLIVSGADTQALFEGQLQANQRYIDEKEAMFGFKVLGVKGTARWVFSKSGGESAYFLNKKSYGLDVSKSHFRMKGDVVEHTNANAYNVKIYSALQATTNNRSRLGVLFT